MEALLERSEPHASRLLRADNAPPTTRHFYEAAERQAASARTGGSAPRPSAAHASWRGPRRHRRRTGTAQREVHKSIGRTRGPRVRSDCVFSTHGCLRVLRDQVPTRWNVRRRDDGSVRSSRRVVVYWRRGEGGRVWQHACVPRFACLLAALCMLACRNLVGRRLLAAEVRRIDERREDDRFLRHAASPRHPCVVRPAAAAAAAAHERPLRRRMSCRRARAPARGRRAARSRRRRSQTRRSRAARPGTRPTCTWAAGTCRQGTARHSVRARARARQARQGLAGVQAPPERERAPTNGCSLVRCTE
jgi:hypothetical protein